MSLEAVQAFRSELATDPALQQACLAAIAQRDAQQVVDAAAARGFTFTVAELEGVLADGELSDQELEMVAGGGVMDSQATEKIDYSRQG